MTVRTATLLAAAALAAGCASVTADGGLGDAARLAGVAPADAPALVRDNAAETALDALLKERLARALGIDDAVHIALLNHRGMQAAYFELGISQADMAQAARLHNPAFSFKRVRGEDGLAIERTLGIGLLEALTLPLSSRIEAQRYEQAKLKLAHAIQSHALEVRRAWIEAVAAQQGLDYAQQVQKAAHASAELAGRMANAGNWSALDRAREQAFNADAIAGVGRASKERSATREKLARLMGLWGRHVAFTLPATLPELPDAPAELEDVEQRAIASRLDVRAARMDVDATASALGLVRATRFVNVMELGLVREREGSHKSRGYEVSIEIPLFDWGGARSARAEAVYMQSANVLAQAAIDARSEARESYLAYRTSYDLARHYRDHVIPLRKEISRETLLRYNGMLESVFELIADAREQIGAVRESIEAQKDFWIEETNLQGALGGRLPAAAPKEHKQ
jgi:outer membrane protein TolC